MGREPEWYEFRDDDGIIRLNTSLVLRLSLWGIAGLFIIIAIAIFAISYWFFPIVMPANEIGDAFGVANALFSALAFALLIYTSILQREELRLQREELKKSNENQKQIIRLTKLINSKDIIPSLSVEIEENEQDEPGIYRLILSLHTYDLTLKLRTFKNHYSGIERTLNKIIPIDKPEMIEEHFDLRNTRSHKCEIEFSTLSKQTYRQRLVVYNDHVDVDGFPYKI